jgi:dTDP-4-amino-4,6-dideoxygalactose transaminase
MNPYDGENSVPNFWLSCLLIHPEAMSHQTHGETQATYHSEPGKSCPMAILEKLAQYNIEGRPIWKPMHMQPIYRHNAFVAATEHGDVGRDIFRRGLCLPSDIKMTPAEQDIVIELVRSCFE